MNRAERDRLRDEIRIHGGGPVGVVVPVLRSLLDAADRAEEYLADLEAINAVMRGEGFGQGTLDDDLAACVKQRMDEKNVAEKRVAELEAAIRKHMNMRGDNRCHIDDHELYMVLPEGDTRPEREVAVMRENCDRFIECRQQGREYVSPQVRIEELEVCLQEMVDGCGPSYEGGAIDCHFCQLDDNEKHVETCPVRLAEELLKETKR